MIRFSLRAILGICVFAFLFSVAVEAQQLATLNVTVTDQSGAVIPKAKVTVRNIETDSQAHRGRQWGWPRRHPGLGSGKI